MVSIMDIQIFDKESLKIKVKKATLAVDPKSSIQKFDADAIILTDKNSDTSRINNFRVVIDAVGEYEVSGLKISGMGSDGDTFFALSSDNVSVLIAKASSLEKAEKVGEYKILIINADADLNQSRITAIEPSVVILYGEKAKEGAKVLGKESAPTLAKITVSEDKLPEEMDVTILA
jgi:hypothetical protein